MQCSTSKISFKISLLKGEKCIKCCICGKEIEKSQFLGVVLCSSECFHKKFWNDIVNEKDEHLIINGECYYNETIPDGIYKGFGGRGFKIKKFDGTIIQTSNLWHQGTVPEEYKDLLPNNAEWIKERK